MRKDNLDICVKKTNGDFGADKNSVTVACGCSCCCMVFVGGGLGGIIGIIYGLIKGALKGIAMAGESGSPKKWFLGICGSIMFALLFGVLGIFLGASLGIMVDIIMGNL